MEFANSAQAQTVPVSVWVLDGGKAIGVLVVGVKFDYLVWKKKRKK